MSIAYKLHKPVPGPAQDTEGSENQAEILEGTTQLPQSQLELLGMFHPHLPHMCAVVSPMYS